MKDKTIGISLLLAFLYIITLVLVIVAGCSEGFRNAKPRVGFFGNIPPPKNLSRKDLSRKDSRKDRNFQEWYSQFAKKRNISAEDAKKIWETLVRG